MYCALGKRRGGWGSKLHLRVERAGKPVAFMLTAGQRHESQALIPLVEASQALIRHPGRPARGRFRPQALVGDKGYTGQPIRAYLRRKGIRAVIPRLATERRRGTRWDARARALYRERNRVERTVNRLKAYRRVATRYEKLASHYLAMVTLAAILLWL